MLFGSFKREIEERAKQETLRLAREWDQLSPEEKSKQSIADFLSRRWRELDEERGACYEQQEARRNEWHGFRYLYLAFGCIATFGCE